MGLRESSCLARFVIALTFNQSGGGGILTQPEQSQILQKLRQSFLVVLEKKNAMGTFAKCRHTMFANLTLPKVLSGVGSYLLFTPKTTIMMF